MILSYTTIVEKLFMELDRLLNDYVFHAYNALVSYLQAPLRLAIILYIVLMGLAITQGWVRLSMSYLVNSSVKLALIEAAAMHWGWCSHYLVDLINQGSEQIGKVLISAMSTSHFTQTGLNETTQSILIEFTNIGNRIWSIGSLYNLGPFLTAILVLGFGYALILVTIFQLVLAKMMLAILFSTAPLFISFTLFKPTYGLFDRWLGVCVGFGLMVIFVSSVSAVSLSMAQWAIVGADLNSATGFALVYFVPIMLIGFIGIGITLKVAQLAEGIGGSITHVSGSSLLAGTIGGTIGRLLPLSRASPASEAPAKPCTDKPSEKQNSSSGMYAIRKTLMKAENRE